MSDQLRPDTSSPGEDFNHNAADVSGIPRTRPAGPPADPPKLTPESERLRDEIEKRLGAFPPYFVPALHRPSVLESYWNQTLICYLDNPLPALFKEKLLARLARFCSVAYAVVSHTTNLREMGMTAGEVLDLLELPIPSSETDIEHQLRILEAESAPLVSWPEHNSSVEKSLIPCMLFFFANPGRSGRCQQAISRLLSAEQYTNLTALFAYIKSYHLWVETYPGPPIETVPQVWDRFVSMLREEPRLAKVFRNYREKTVERRGQTGFEALQQSHAELESKLKKNTSDLAKAVEILKDEIARRKRVEKELSDRQEQYKELFENTYDLVFTYNVSGKITSLNNAAERLSGYPRDEALRLNIAQLMAPDSMEVVQEMLYSDVSSGVPARYELAMVTKGNQRVEVELNQRRITSPGGTAEFQAIVRPIGDGNREVKDVRDTDGIAEGSVSRAIAESEPLLLQKTAELLKANELLQARNGEREHTMEALRRMLAESEIRSAELERANKSLQEKIAKLEQADKTTEDTRQRSQQEIGQPSEATRALHAQVEERERDIEALRKVLAESETRSAVLLKATETFRAQMEEREHTEQNLRQALSESEARHAALLKTIEALQTRIDDYERTAEALRRASTNTETHLRQQVDELAELRDALQAGGGEHERTVQALRAALAESEARRSEIAQAHEACQAKIVEYEAIRKTSADTEARRQQQVDELVESNQALRTGKEESDRTVEALRLALADSEARFEEASKVVRDSQASLEEREGVLEALRKDVAEEETRYRQQVDELSKMNEALQAGSGGQERTVEALRMALSDSEARFSELSRTHKNCQTRLGEYERVVEQLRASTEEAETRLRQQLDELVRKNEDLLAASGDHERTLAAMRAELADSSARFAELSRTHENCPVQIAEHEGTATALRASLADSEARFAELSKAHEECPARIAEHQGSAEALRTSLADSEERFAELSRAHEECPARIAEHQRSADVLRASLADSEARFAELSRTHEECPARIAEQERSAEALRTSLADSEERFAELSRAHEECPARIAEQERSAEALRTSLADSIAHSTELSKDIEACQTQIRQHEGLVQALREALADSEARFAELFKSHEFCQTQIDERGRTVEALRLALAESEQRVADLAKAHAASQDQIAEHQRIVEAIRKAAEDLEVRIQGEMVELVRDNEDLRVQLDEHQQTEEELRKALSDSDSLSAELHRANEALQVRVAGHEETRENLRQAQEQLQVWQGRFDAYARQLGLISEMGSMLMACENMNEAVAVIGQLIEQIFPEQAGGLYLLRPDRNLAQAAIEWGEPASSADSFETDACFAFRRNRVHVINNIHSGLICRHVKTTIPSGYLCVPMMARGEVLGIFHVRQREGTSPSETEQRLAVTVSEYIAMAFSHLTRHDGPHAS